MIKTTVLSLSLVVLVAGVAIAQQAVPMLLTQAVSQTQALKRDYAFDVVQDGDGTIDGAAQAQQHVHWRAHYDPAGVAPHLHLVEPQHLQGSQQDAFNKVAEKMRGVNWCASTEMGAAQNMHLVREDANSAFYTFQPNRAQLSGQAAQMADRLHGEMTLTKNNPDISDVHMFITQPFNVMMISTVSTLDIVQHCETAPNGRRYAAQTTMRLAGSALGKNFTQSLTSTLSNLAAS